MSTLGKAYQVALNGIENRVSKAIEEFCDTHRIVYSAYEMDQFDTPIDNLDDVPVKGKVKFTTEDGSWESDEYESPTWLQIAVIVNHMINETEDYYNKYFMDFDIVDNRDGVMICQVVMGIG